MECLRIILYYFIDLGSLSGIANAWLKQTEHDLIKFWQNTVDDDKVLNDMLYVSALCCCANSEITENKSVGGNEPASNLCSVCCLPKSKRHFARGNDRLAKYCKVTVG